MIVSSVTYIYAQVTSLSQSAPLYLASPYAHAYAAVQPYAVVSPMVYQSPMIVYQPAAPQCIITSPSHQHHQPKHHHTQAKQQEAPQKPGPRVKFQRPVTARIKHNVDDDKYFLQDDPVLLEVSSLFNRNPKSCIIIPFVSGGSACFQRGCQSETGLHFLSQTTLFIQFVQREASIGLADLQQLKRVFTAYARTAGTISADSVVDVLREMGVKLDLRRCVAAMDGEKTSASAHCVVFDR